MPSSDPVTAEIRMKEAAEWARQCLHEVGDWRWMCPECADAYARQQVEAALVKLETLEHTCMDSCCRDDAIAALRALKGTP